MKKYKHKCAEIDCHEDGTLPWEDKAYFCDKHFLEHLRKEKKECGLK